MDKDRAPVVGEWIKTERYWNDADRGEWPGIELGALPMRYRHATFSGVMRNGRIVEAIARRFRITL